ncbi:hypothetical protein DPMN_082670 [Dreissena polymorpha]|uniref:G-protein coupled receptors family 1 profile domain-containing protein n=1 Tax=Dreissena polymorpha TaxID=45954 RepID=A0A9D4BJ23_DREPO|nr:hypothetical protein DPMN_082670 [Dreissena polymorpha]
MSQEETNSSGLELVDYVTLTYDDIANVTTADAYNNPSDNDLFLTRVIVQCVILALAIFGNVVLFITMRMRKRALTRVHWFILHLCLADLLVAFFNILPQLIWDVIGEWKAGDFMCRFIKFMQVFVMYLSTYVLVLTALDRRRAICSPLLSHTWTHRLIHLSVGGAYAISAVLSVPQAVIFKYQETSNGSGYMNCWVHFEPEWTLHFYVTSFYVLVYIIPLLILIYAYGSIYYAIFIRHKQSKLPHNNSYEKASTHGTLKDSKTDPVLKRNGITIKGLRVCVLSTSSSKTSKLRNSSRPVLRTNSFAGLSRAKMRTVKLTLVIIVAYIGCWSPFFISQLWWLYDVNAPTNSK